MNCPFCGTENPEGSAACENCGQNLLEAQLAWQAEGEPLQALPLNRSLSIGRVAGNDVVITDSAMSRQHARIEVTEDGIALVDLGSLNGTFLNGERINEETLMADGDVIKVGRTLLTVSLQPVAAPAEPIEPAFEATVALDEGAVARAMQQRDAGATMLMQPERIEPEPVEPESSATMLVEPERPEPADADSGATMLAEPASTEAESGATMLMQPEPAEPARVESTGERTALAPAHADDSASDATLVAPSPIAPEPEPVPAGPVTAGYLVAGDIRAPIITVISLGRSEGNDIRIEGDRLVSRNHARVENRPDGVWLEDLQSANGTFQNEVQVTEPVLLSDGDELKFGATVFMFEAAAKPVATPARPPAPAPEPESEPVSTPTELVGAGAATAPGGTDVLPAVSDSYDSGATIAIPAELPDRTLPGPVAAGADDSAAVKPTDQYQLVVNFGPETGRSFPFTKDSMVIGRASDDADYDIQLNDRAVSRPHARITREGDTFTIHDLDSANGTWVNYTEEISSPRQLADGDVIKLGKTTLVFRVPAAVRPAAPEIVLDPTAGQILTAFSLKGGVGTTTIAVNTAIAFRQLAQQSVLIIDLSTERGAVGVHMNLSPKLTMADLPQDPGSIDWEVVQSVIVHHDSGVDVLSAPPSPQTAELVTAAAVSAILPLARARYKWVIIDTSPTFSELNLGVFDQSDLLLLPLAPDMTSVKIMQSMLDVFAALQTPAERRVLILNQMHPRAHIGQAEIEQHLGERIGLIMPYAEDAILDSIDQGVPLAAVNPSHPTIAAIQAFAGKLAQVKVEAGTQAKRGGLGGWVQGFIGSLRK